MELALSVYHRKHEEEGGANRWLHTCKPTSVQKVGATIQTSADLIPSFQCPGVAHDQANIPVIPSGYWGKHQSSISS